MSEKIREAGYKLRAAMAALRAELVTEAKYTRQELRSKWRTAKRLQALDRELDRGYNTPGERLKIAAVTGLIFVLVMGCCGVFFYLSTYTHYEKMKAYSYSTETQEIEAIQ